MPAVQPRRLSGRSKLIAGSAFVGLTLLIAGQPGIARAEPSVVPGTRTQDAAQASAAQQAEPPAAPESGRPVRDEQSCRPGSPADLGLDALVRIVQAGSRVVGLLSTHAALKNAGMRADRARAAGCRKEQQSEPPVVCKPQRLLLVPLVRNGRFIDKQESCSASQR